jgi:hypothetical protein
MPGGRKEGQGICEEGPGGMDRGQGAADAEVTASPRGPVPAGPEETGRHGSTRRMGQQLIRLFHGPARSPRAGPGAFVVSSRA